MYYLPEPNFKIQNHEMEMPGNYKAFFVTFNIKSGNKHVESRTFVSRTHFLECLNRWNIIGDGNWLHYESLEKPEFEK